MALKHVDGKVVVSVDLEGKNWHTFSDGTKIRLERQFNNLNRRETEPVNAIVVSGANITEGSEILIHPNAPCESNQIINFAQLSGKETASDTKYYSIPEDMCFVWNDNGNWRPLPPYETALFVYEPYKGSLVGIEPKLIKDVLFVLTGNLKGNIVHCIVASAYVIIFQDITNRESQICRFRPNGDDRTNREPEAVCVRDDLNKRLKNNELLIGMSIKKAVTLKEYAKIIGL